MSVSENLVGDPAIAEVLKPPVVEFIGDGKARTTCAKCGTIITIDFGGLDRTEAARLIREMDRIPRECPGYHVELSGWRRLWHLDECLEAVYGKEVPSERNPHN